MLKGVYLTLMIGPAVPIIAPKVVMDALTGIQVTNSKDRSGFQITFSVSKSSILLNTMLPAGYFDPITTRVIVVATMNGFPNVLIDGLVTSQELAPSNEPGKSTLTITGEDLSLAMDLIEKITPYPAMPDVAKLYAILGPYAVLGIIPVVIPPIISMVKSPTTKWESQKSTDRNYLKSMATQCGYMFYVQPGPMPGQSIAYFGPDVNLPVPQPALSINMDAQSNVESLNFSFDGMAKKVRIYTIYDPITHKIPIPIPIPNINVFKPPLGLKPAPPSKIEFAEDVAKLAPEDAAKGILGYLMNSSNSNSISVSGSLDVLRYRNILRSRMLVGVRGAGVAYDGMYYVDSVTHNIKQGQYKQNFTLSRDGLVSMTPRVRI